MRSPDELLDCSGIEMSEIPQPIRRTLHGQQKDRSSNVQNLPPIPEQRSRDGQPAKLLHVLEQLGGAAGLQGTRPMIRALESLLALLDAAAQGAHDTSAAKENAVPMELDRIAATLPRRQGEVLRALKEGLSEKQIATRLKISHHTVHIYVKALYRRFGVNTRSELIALWLSEK
jgi:DNA-binding CsgD family transcriptional regulator